MRRSPSAALNGHGEKKKGKGNETGFKGENRLFRSRKGIRSLVRRHKVEETELVLAEGSFPCLARKRKGKIISGTQEGSSRILLRRGEKISLLQEEEKKKKVEKRRLRKGKNSKNPPKKKKNPPKPKKETPFSYSRR